MLATLAALLLSVPDAPVPVTPSPDGGWARASFIFFGVGAYNDPSGFPQRSLSVELRREDGGFDAGVTELATNEKLKVQGNFGPEGGTWVWHARYTNDQGQSSPWSAEASFRIDDTPPTAPTSIDAGLVSPLSAQVRVDFTPGTDALSGIVAHAINLGPTPDGPWYDYVEARPGPPLFETVGAGTWWLWVESFDRAGNPSGLTGTGPIATVSITADLALPVLPPPLWHNEPFPRYGELVEWSPQVVADAGYGDVVFSFCDVDAGCVWRVAPPAVPASLRVTWLQTNDEGFFRARMAGVRGGRVSPWSAASNMIVLDRTGPTCPAPTAVILDAGLVQISWGPCVEPLTAVATLQLEERRVGSGSGLVPVVNTSVLRQPGPGVWQWRLRAQDTFGNIGDFGPPSNTVMLTAAADAGPQPDAGTEPDAGAIPDAGASPPDGGATLPDGGPPSQRVLDVHCGCGSGGPFLLLLLLPLLRRRRPLHE